jgi:hypothetical protein
MQRFPRGELLAPANHHPRLLLLLLLSVTCR